MQHKKSITSLCMITNGKASLVYHTKCVDREEDFTLQPAGMMHIVMGFARAHPWIGPPGLQPERPVEKGRSEQVL
jgi:hypothetical protein